MPRAAVPRLIVTLLAAALLPACGGEAERITVTPTSHDFGRVRQGERPTRVFTVTNHTSRVVSVMPQPNCSCFAVPRGLSLEPLDPGESIEIRVMFDSTAKPPGPVQGKWVTFNFDHPEQRQVVVPLKGEIYRAFLMQPDKLNLGLIDGRPAAHAPRTVAIRPEPGNTVKVQRVVVTPDAFDVTQAPGERGAVELRIALRRDLRPRPLGAFRAVARVELEVGMPDGTTFTQRPSIEIIGSWALKPDGTPIGPPTDR